MSITIKQRQKKWRLEINQEEWEYPDRESMEIDLKELLDMKVDKGELKEIRSN